MFTRFIAPVSIDHTTAFFMKSFSLIWRRLFAAGFLFLTFIASAQELIPLPSFQNFAQRARSGETMMVVFFGGSLTWGEGASDPERTSFRALLQNYLKEKYPRAHFVFHDSAIDGAGSRLGMFRVERDVIAHHPDLVFIDFTVDDKIDKTDRESLASYERILNDLISKGIPVAQILLGTKDNFGIGWTHLGPPRFRDHLELGTLYHVAIGNSLPAIQNFLKSETHTRDQIWPEDDAYPGDLGHRFIYEATRDGLEQAIREKRICSLPMEPVFAEEYQNRLQLFPATGKLPTGWRVGKTLRPVLETAEISNGWKSQVAVCDSAARDIAEPIQLNFNGTFLGILGEADEHGLGFKVSVDGHPMFYNEKKKEEVWPTSTASLGGGERFFWHEISAQLEPGRHDVEVLPVFPEGATKGTLRVESICVAGPDTQDVQNLAVRPAHF